MYDDESGSGYGGSDDESVASAGGGSSMVPSRKRRRRLARRLFTHQQRNECWDKAPPVPGRDPARWRYDAAGNVVVRRLLHCEGCLCYDFDHIVPYSKGGLTERTLSSPYQRSFKSIPA